MEYFAFQWHISDNCDQRCQHCYIFAENTKHVMNEMSWGQLKYTFDSCLDFCNQTNQLPYFYITGGDPILHKQFWDLLELIK